MPKSNSMRLGLITLTLLFTLTIADAGIITAGKRGKVIVSVITGNVVSAMVTREPIRRGQNKARRSMASGKYVFIAQPEKESFKLNEPIILRLFLSNHSDKDIYVIQTNPTRDNQLEITNARGEKIPLSEKGKRLLDSPVLRRIVSRIAAGETIQYAISANDLYDLTAHDAYTVTVKRRILMKDKKTFVEVKSNPVKVIIQ